jgi:dihydroorotase
LLGLEGGHLSAGAPADLTIIDPDLEWEVETSQFLSRSRNCPFAGRRLKGRAVMTIVKGEVVYSRRELKISN